MLEQFSKSKAAILLDRIHEVKLPVILLTLITVADVGLLNSAGKSLYAVAEAGVILPGQVVCIVLSIIIFLLFNSLLAFFLRTVLSSLIMSLLKVPSPIRSSEYFTVDELLLYAIRYNNKILENVHIRYAQEHGNKRQLKNVLFSLLVFISIDMAYTDSLLRSLSISSHPVLCTFLLLFMAGCVVYILFPDEDESSSTLISKRFRSDLEKKDGSDDYLFPQNDKE